MTIYPFDTTDDLTLRQVGGKALNLIKTTNAGLRVPQGLALSVEFFAPWLETIKGTDGWKALLADPSRANCDRLKSEAQGPSRALSGP